MRPLWYVSICIVNICIHMYVCIYIYIHDHICMYVSFIFTDSWSCIPVISGRVRLNATVCSCIRQVIAAVAGRVVGVDQQPELVAQVVIPVSPLQLRDVLWIFDFHAIFYTLSISQWFNAVPLFFLIAVELRVFAWNIREYWNLWWDWIWVHVYHRTSRPARTTHLSNLRTMLKGNKTKHDQDASSTLLCWIFRPFPIYMYIFPMIAIATDATAIQHTLWLRQNFDAFDSTKLVAMASETGDGDQKWLCRSV